MKKKRYHQLALILAVLAVILALGSLIWGERGTVFIAIIPVLLAGMLEQMIIHNNIKKEGTLQLNSCKSLLF